MLVYSKLLVFCMYWYLKFKDRKTCYKDNLYKYQVKRLQKHIYIHCIFISLIFATFSMISNPLLNKRAITSFLTTVVSQNLHDFTVQCTLFFLNETYMYIVRYNFQGTSFNDTV